MMSKNPNTGTARMKVIIAFVTACVIAAGIVGCSSTEQRKEADFTGVRSVCELSTLKCYYHNVATVYNPASGPFADLLKTGYKRLWIEYSGTVELGIDASQVKIGTPDEQGTVEVYVPEVQILSVSLDKESIGDLVSETGLFTDITAEEKMAGISAAQDDMKETASQDQSLRTQAYDHSRRVIKGYVENVGAAIGESYTVKWVENSDAVH